MMLMVHIQGNNKFFQPRRRLREGQEEKEIEIEESCTEVRPS